MDFKNKYRPVKLEDVVGQEAVVASLQRRIKKNDVEHAILFHGPSGTGKTTLARIVASSLGCDPSEIQEYDAASNSGIDAWRAVTAGCRFKPMSGKVRVLIVDECHALSPSAWTGLLKSIEEPPPHAYWMFCTTVLSKVPKNIATRCMNIGLTAVSPEDIERLVKRVCKSESIELKSKIVDLVVESAEGSPRQALVSLQAVAGAASVKEAQQILQRSISESEIVELSRMLVSGKLNWVAAMKIVNSIENPQPESWRYQIRGYVSAVVKNEKQDSRIVYLLNVLDNMSKPFGSGKEGLPDFLVALGACLYATEN